MPTFDAATEAKDEPLELPIPGRDGLLAVYKIQPLSAAGLIDLSMVEKAVRNTFIGLGDKVPAESVAKLDAMTEQQFVELCIGVDTLAAMIANGVGARMLTAACLTAQKWHLNGIAAAHEVWERLAVKGADPTEPTHPANGGRHTPVTTSTANRSSSTSRKKHKTKVRAGRR